MLLAYNHYSSALTPQSSQKDLSNLAMTKILGVTKVLVLALAGMSMIYWLFLFGNNIVLNYKIDGLRNQVTQTKQEISSLQLSASKLVDNNALKEWARANDFVPVEQLGYLSFSDNDLAKLSQYNF